MIMKNRKALEDAIVRMSDLYRLCDIKGLSHQRLLEIYKRLISKETSK